jgi:hypothetical protein
VGKTGLLTPWPGKWEGLAVGRNKKRKDLCKSRNTREFISFLKNPFISRKLLSHYPNDLVQSTGCMKGFQSSLVLEVHA